MSIGSIRFSGNKFRTTLEAIKGSGQDAERNKWEANAPYHLKDKYQFTAGGTVFTVVEYNPRAKTMPIIAMNDNGTRYKFGTEVVL